MLRIRTAECHDCLKVINHLLAEYLGISDCITAKDRGLLTTRVNIESDMNRLISVLNASGIDVTLVSSDDISYENECLQTKQIRCSSTNNNNEIGEYVQDVECLAAILDPSNWCQRGHCVPAWCVCVTPLSTLRACISVLTQLHPLPDLISHVKRAFVTHSGQEKVGRILLGLASKSFTEEAAKNLTSKLQEVAGTLRVEMESCLVPLCPPRSCRQQKILSSFIKVDGAIRCWPFTFHPNNLLESLLSIGDLEDRRNETAKPYFTNSEIKWHNYWLRRAINLAKIGKIIGKNAPCDLENRNLVCTCIVVYPHSVTQLDPSEAQPLAETMSTTAESCLDHAVMLACKHIGRLNKELKKNNIEGTPGSKMNLGNRYLMTGCDVYLSTEPCLMCAMALLHSRAARIFIARCLPNNGGLCSRWKLPLIKALNHHFLVFAPFHKMNKDSKDPSEPDKPPN